MIFFCTVTATTELYTYIHTLSLHDALPICQSRFGRQKIVATDVSGVIGNGIADRQQLALRIKQEGEVHGERCFAGRRRDGLQPVIQRSEEHTSELQSLLRISSAVVCLQKTTHYISTTSSVSKLQQLY